VLGWSDGHEGEEGDNARGKHHDTTAYLKGQAH
jgi:hypothetical protein